jgi:cytochrome d ubiquinol oxidase subunit I
MTVAASFGLASALSVVVLGDESGYTAGLNQRMKIAAIEAEWQTEPAPASFTVIGLPDVAARTTHYAIRVPWVLGLIATRSIDGEVAGIGNLVAEAERRIRDGMIAYGALAGAPNASRRCGASGAVSFSRRKSWLRAAAETTCTGGE